MEKLDLSTLDSFLNSLGALRCQAPAVPVEYFRSEIRKATGLSDKELLRMDMGDIESRLGGLRFSRPCLLPGIHEFTPPPSELYQLIGPYQKRRHRQVVDRLLKQDQASAKKSSPIPALLRI